MEKLKRFRILFPSLAIAFVLGGCGPTDPEEDAEFPETSLVEGVSGSGKLVFELRTAPQPPVRGTNLAEFTFLDSADRAPVEGLMFTVEPWMPAHGHGSTSVPKVEEVGDGRYLVREVNFTMAGEWVLRVRIEAPFADDLEAPFMVR